MLIYLHSWHLAVILIVLICDASVNPSFASASALGMDQVPSAVRYHLPGSILENTYSFAGEVIPIRRADVASRILAQVNFLLMDARSVLAQWLTEKSRYAWLFEEIFRKEGVPLEFVFLAPVLSGAPRNSTRSVPTGFWLLETPCAQSEGVEMSDDNWHDDRLDLELSSRCFASRIKAIQKELIGGSWLLAVAAYVTSLKTVQDTQLKWDSNSFWDLPLPQAAEQIVCRWIALSVISSNTACYGLRFKPASPVIFDQVNDVVLARDLPIAEIARMTGTPPREILLINPKIKPSEPIFQSRVGGKLVRHTVLAPKGKGELLLDKLKNSGYLVSDSIH